MTATNRHRWSDTMSCLDCGASFGTGLGDPCPVAPPASERYDPRKAATETADKILRFLNVGKAQFHRNDILPDLEELAQAAFDAAKDPAS